MFSHRRRLGAGEVDQSAEAVLGILCSRFIHFRPPPMNAEPRAIRARKPSAMNVASFSPAFHLVVRRTGSKSFARMSDRKLLAPAETQHESVRKLG